MKGYKRLRDRRKAENRKGGIRSWQLVVENGRDERGRRRQIFRSFQGTSPQADTALRRLIDEVESGRYTTDSGTTLGEWLVEWMAHKVVGSRSIKRNSVYSYRYLMDLHIVPALGKLRLSQCTTYRIQEFIDGIAAHGRLSRGHVGEPLSSSTVHRVYAVLFAALSYAVRMKRLQNNPAVDVELPRRRKAPSRSLEVLEARALLKAARDTRLYQPILLALCTGLRRGEILGLRWGDIDFVKAQLCVQRQIIRGNVVDEPKRPASVRTIRLPEFVVRELSRYSEHQTTMRGVYGAHYIDEGYVFATEFGRSWNPDGINTLFRAIVKRAGISRLRFHDLRHSAASLLLAAGVPIPIVSEMLGHDDKAFTMREYIHAQADGQSAAAAYMQSTFADDGENAD